MSADKGLLRGAGLALLAMMPACSPSTPSGVAAATLPTGSYRGGCSISVGGVSYLDAKTGCLIENVKGIIGINADRAKGDYFAYVSPGDNIPSLITWNSRDRWRKAEESLGEDFEQQGRCWTNARARICASVEYVGHQR